MITRIGNIDDINGVMELQKKNLFSNLSEEDIKKGFVTTPFSEEQLMNLISQRGLFAAEDKKRIIGYVMAANWDFFLQWPIFQFMIDKFNSLKFAGKSISVKNTFEYGPVCIDETYRGSGLLQKLFEEMRLELFKRFPIGITFINKINQVSFAAHTKKLKLVVIDEFEFSGKNYYMLAFDTAISVL